MMVLGIQILGLLFGLIMIYITHMNYQNKNLDKKSSIFWILVWIIFIIFIVAPVTLTLITQALNIGRRLDFLIMITLALVIAVVFHNYVQTKKTDKKIENIIRNIAIEDKENEDTDI